jgi:hypothetical protein
VPQARASAGEKADGLGWLRGLREKREGERDGPAGLGGKRGEEKSFFLFLNLFSNSFSNFQTSIKQETLHSNHDAQSLIISYFIQVIFKYLKSQFI